MRRQTWKSVQRPWWDASEGCVHMNWGVKGMLHTDASMETFIRANYPSFKDTYAKLNPIQRGDFIRYLALYHYGA